ncbi:hypothetical protein BDW59DRAFT_29009 [Aspergillus cavernicola]|uniref:Uncharacterized protein n=1 Tax=Aspergillus cavernicola TaxID=176166 RepID=A0ABR4IQE9_9EURO
MMKPIRVQVMSMYLLVIWYLVYVARVYPNPIPRVKTCVHQKELSSFVQKDQT